MVELADPFFTFHALDNTENIRYIVDIDVAVCVRGVLQLRAVMTIGNGNIFYICYHRQGCKDTKKLKGLKFEAIKINNHRKCPVGSDASAASGGYRELSEWQRSTDGKALCRRSQMSGTATGMF